MNKIALAILTVALISFAYVSLKPSTSSQAHNPLPWDIQTDSEGYSRVFGIDIGHSTLSQVTQVIGEDHEIAVISDNNDKTALELYVPHYKSGPLSAKLIIGFAVDDQLLLNMKQQADHKEYMASGSRKFLLNENDLQTAQSLIVRSISFIPGARLNPDIVTARFGKPDQIIAATETENHYLYPDKGLDIVLNNEAKDRLQYVAPKDFSLLSAPLAASGETP